MLWLIKKLLLGKWCDHTWETKGSVRIFESESDKLPSKLHKHCQCQKCGAWRKFTL